MAAATASTNHRQRRPTFLLVVLSVAVVLWLLGLFALMLIQANELNRLLKEKVDIIVEVNDSLATATVEEIGIQLGRQRYVREASVEYVSKEEALRQLSKTFGEEILRLELPNPLYNSFVFNASVAYLSPDSLRQIKDELLQLEGVADVYYQESLADQLALNFRSMLWVLLGIGLLLLFFSTLLIHSVVRLALNADRFLIKTQELVGASWDFITRPYLWKSVRNGFFSALLALLSLAALQWWMETELPELRQLRNPLAWGVLAAIIVLLGVGINWLSTYVTVRRYLRLRVDDLY
jgi:cell division transport system permease protein